MNIIWAIVSIAIGAIATSCYFVLFLMKLGRLLGQETFAKAEDFRLWPSRWLLAIFESSEDAERDRHRAEIRGFPVY